MNFGIVINLDYQSGDPKQVKELFDSFRARLEQRGFIMDGRLFTITAPRDEVVSKGRQVLEDLDREYSMRGEDIYMHVREFYCVQLNCITNLLVPDSGAMDVHELDSLEDVFSDLWTPKKSND